VELTDRHGTVLELVAAGAVSQGLLARSVRGAPAQEGYEELAEAVRELAAAGYIRPPQRCARWLHRNCRAELTARGWTAVKARLRATVAAKEGLSDV
jgi:hypothetical protein